MKFHNHLSKLAEKTECKRKGVYAAYVSLTGRLGTYAINGPMGFPCSNEVGNCGCMHAEIKLLLDCEIKSPHIFMTEYAPCTNCANALIFRRKNIKAIIYYHKTPHDMRGLRLIESTFPCECLETLDERKLNDCLQRKQLHGANGARASWSGKFSGDLS